MRFIQTIQRISFLMLLVAVGFLLSSFAHASDNKDIMIIKSPHDSRDYKILVLPNQLEVLLISDPGTDRAAVAMDIHVGQFDDPPDKQGLTHFLEHMLFLGSDKHPDADEYSSYLASHGGLSNAYTGFEDTNFFFSIHKDYLGGALDRFAQFFIAPRFEARFVEREINAVHSEHQKNLKSDDRRIYQVIKSTTNPLHPFSKFGTGSLETLYGENPDPANLRKRLLQFYQANYSANRMKLVVLGKESIEDLEALAVKNFSEVPNKKLEIKKYDHISVIDDSLPRKINIKSIKEIRRLQLMFPMPSTRRHFKSKPGDMIGHLLGDETEGSVLSYLKQKGWATSLSAGAGSESKDFAFFGVEISLTQAGVDHIDEIIQSVFIYLNIIRNDNNLSRYFDELKRIGEISFQFKEKESPYSYVSRLASNLQRLPAKYVLISRWYYDSYDDKLVKDLLSYLAPDNLQLILISREAPVDSVEKQYKTPYSIVKINKEDFASLENKKLVQQLKLPKANPFIPGTVTLKNIESESQIPQLVKNTKGNRIWFKQDNEFKVPKANVRLRLATPLAYSSVKNAAMTKLFTLLLQENLNEFSYPAHVAGLRYAIMNSVEGIEISISGYSENIELLFRKVVDSMLNFVVEENKLKIYKNQTLERRKNQKLQQAFHRAEYELYYLLSTPLWHNDEYVSVISSISKRELEIFVKKLLSQMHIEMLANGNVSKKEVLQFGEFLESAFQQSENNLFEVVNQRTMMIPVKPSYTHQFKIEDLNSAVILYYQAGEKVIEQTVLLDMIQQFLEKRFYHQLRTIEQLGYVVWSGYRQMNNIEGFFFLIQSNVQDPVYLQKRIEAFLKKGESALQEITQKEFDEYREALIARRMEQPKNLQEQTQRYWHNISSRNYDFEHRLKETEHLKKLKSADVLMKYRSLFLSGDSTRKLSIQSVGKSHQEKKPTGRKISNVKEFKKQMKFYENPEVILKSD